MKQIRGVFRECGERVGAEPGAAAEIGREISADEFAFKTKALDVVVFERNGVKSKGGIVAFILRRNELGMLVCLSGVPAEKLGAVCLANRCIRKLLAYRVN